MPIRQKSRSRRFVSRKFVEGKPCEFRITRGQLREVLRTARRTSDLMRGAQRMKAMVYRGPYRVRVEEKAIPKIEHPNDAIVRVTRAAICGSDLHLYHGMMPDTRIGHTFGHEFIGVVDQVGSSVEHLKPGDRVMVPFNIYCGSCFFCARGLYSNCHNVNPNATAVGGIYGY